MQMPGHIASLLAGAVLAILFLGWLLPKGTTPPTPEIGDERTHVAQKGSRPVVPPVARVDPAQPRPLTEAEAELERLEAELARQFPLAGKFRDYQKTDPRNLDDEGALARVKSYTDQPGDVRTKNLRSGNLNIIMELMAPIMMKEVLTTNSEYGQMLRVSFNGPRWRWDHLLRNLDDRIGAPDSRRSPISSPEQFVAAVQEREERILAYCRKMQEEASMPDDIREAVEKMTDQMLARSVVSAYFEAITPPELKEARQRVAREAKKESPTVTP